MARAGGGLVMTTSDFARFGAAHLEPDVLSRRVLDDLFTVHGSRYFSAARAGSAHQSRQQGTTALASRWRTGRCAIKRRLPRSAVVYCFRYNATGTPADVLSPSERLADAL